MNDRPQHWLQFLCLAALIGFGCPVQGQTCAPYYADLGAANIGGLQYSSVYTSFDDGLGPTVARDYWNTNETPGVLAWRNGIWSPLASTGLPSPLISIFRLTVLDMGSGPRLHAIARGGNPDAYHLVGWDGQSWTDTGVCMLGGCSGYVHVGWEPITVNLGDGPRLYSTGDHANGGNVIVARWDPSGWTQIGASNNGSLHLLNFNDGTGPALYAIGTFSTIGGIPAAGIAKWDGQAWSSPASGANPVITASFSTVADLGDGQAIYSYGGVAYGPTISWGISKFDGHRWTFVGAPDPRLPPQTPSYVDTMLGFDDGRGTALYIAGIFSGFAGVPAHNLVRYDGRGFEAVGAGITGEPLHLVPLRDRRGWSLYIAGDLTGAGGGVLQQAGTFLVGCRDPRCYADCDLSGSLSVSDFICFLNAFARRDPYANCDGSTASPALNISDFTCYISQFSAGCP